MTTTATIRDIEELYKLVNHAYRGEESKKGWTTEAFLIEGERITENQLEKLIYESGGLILKYTEDDKIQGCVHLKKESDKLYLGMLSVFPELQGKGIGKILLKASEDHAKKLGITVIEMTVITVRSELIEWYERHGYMRTGKIKPFPEHTAEVLKQPLEFYVLEKKHKL